MSTWCMFAFCLGHNVLIAVADTDPCQPYQDPTVFTKAIPFGNDSCYFIVKNATRDSNVKWYRCEDNDDECKALGPNTYSFMFNVTTAREICWDHNANLAIVHSESEDQFIWEQFNGADYDPELNAEEAINWVALGIVVMKAGSELIWDDCSDVDYGCNKCLGNWTVSAGNVDWFVWPTGDPNKPAVGVLCKHHPDWDRFGELTCPLTMSKGTAVYGGWMTSVVAALILLVQ